jgi:hypothetical protein
MPFNITYKKYKHSFFHFKKKKKDFFFRNKKKKLIKGRKKIRGAQVLNFSYRISHIIYFSRGLVPVASS